MLLIIVRAVLVCETKRSVRVCYCNKSVLCACVTVISPCCARVQLSTLRTITVNSAYCARVLLLTVCTVLVCYCACALCIMCARIRVGQFFRILNYSVCVW